MPLFSLSLLLGDRGSLVFAFFGSVFSGLYSCACLGSCVCISGFGVPASLLSHHWFLFVLCLCVLLVRFLCVWWSPQWLSFHLSLVCASIFVALVDSLLCTFTHMVPLFVCSLVLCFLVCIPVLVWVPAFAFLVLVFLLLCFRIIGF